MHSITLRLRLLRLSKKTISVQNVCTVQKKKPEKLPKNCPKRKNARKIALLLQKKNHQRSDSNKTHSGIRLGLKAPADSQQIACP